LLQGRAIMLRHLIYAFWEFHDDFSFKTAGEPPQPALLGQIITLSTSDAHWPLQTCGRHSLLVTSSTHANSVPHTSNAAV